MSDATNDLPRADLTDSERLALLRGLKNKTRFLYEAHGGFRIAMAAFDLATVLFFLVTTFMPPDDWILWADFAIGTALLIDFSARLWISRDKRRFAFSIWTAIDVVVIVSMLAPMFLANYAFLRIMRAMRLLRSYALIRSLKRKNSWFAERGEMLMAATNLLVFIFVISAFVYVDQIGSNEKVKNYVDAVYFTVTTLTTTGFGDITLEGTHGKLLAILVMLLGVG